MLILRRHPNEAILIDVPASDKPTRIRLLLCATSESRASLGFDADKSVEIVREELVGQDGSVRLNH